MSGGRNAHANSDGLVLKPYDDGDFGVVQACIENISGRLTSGWHAAL